MIFAANSPAVTEAGTNSLFRLGAIFRSTGSGLGRCGSPERAFGVGHLIVITPSKLCDALSISALT